MHEHMDQRAGKDHQERQGCGYMGTMPDRQIAADDNGGCENESASIGREAAKHGARSIVAGVAITPVQCGRDGRDAQLTTYAQSKSRQNTFTATGLCNL
jgi:hypothetical protein